MLIADSDAIDNVIFQIDYDLTHNTPFKFPLALST